MQCENLAQSNQAPRNKQSMTDANNNTKENIKKTKSVTLKLTK